MALNITISGYGCYKDETTFNFEGPGLVLLQAMSGSGKTTIFEGMQFCLYGKPSKVPWGEVKAKSKVILRFGGMEIIRISGKEKVTVNTEDSSYEGRAAQDIIDTTFGKNFSITSYITQDNTETFFNLGPNDRMVFLEKLAFGEDSNIEGLKGKCKEKKKEREIRLSECTGRIRVLTGESERHPLPELVPCPFKGPYTEEKDEKEKENMQKVKNNLEKNKKKLVKLKDDYSKSKIILNNKETLEGRKDAIIDEINTLKDEAENIVLDDIEEINSKISYLSYSKELEKSRALLANDMQNYEAMEIIEVSQLQGELDSLLVMSCSITEKDISEMEEKSNKRDSYNRLDKKISSIKSEIDDYDTVENYEEIISDSREEEERLMNRIMISKERSSCYKCPKCSSYLKFRDNLLHLSEIGDDKPLNLKELEGELKKIRKEKSEYESSLGDLKSLNNNLQKLEKEKSELGDVDMTIDYKERIEKMRDEYRSSIDRGNRIKLLQRKIANKEFSATFQSIAKRVNTRRADILRIEESLSLISDKYRDMKEDLTTLQNNLTRATTNRNHHNLLTKQIKAKELQLEKIIQEIDSIVIDENDYETLIREKEDDIVGLEEKVVNYENRRKGIEEHKIYLLKLKEHNYYKDKLTEEAENEDKCRKSLVVIEKMLKKINETEALAITNTVNNLNIHLQYYLDKFFPEPIEVEISTFKEVSGIGKPVINITLNYKGCEAQIRDLSGGERARIELSICLAINSIIGGKILLLDEVFKCLDFQTSSDILDVLRKEAHDNNKLIVMVSHQLEEGNFDSIIRI